MNQLALPDLTPAEARDLTDRIRERVTELLPLITEAWERRAWSALGYQAWSDYCDTELRGVRLPVGERREAVGALRENGMSTRAIGSALGVSDGTVRNDLSATAQNYAVAGVTGVNGKTYAPSQPEPRDPENEPEIDFGDAQPAQSQAAGDPFANWSEDERELLKRIREGETVVVSLRGAHDNLIRWADSAGLYERIDRKSVWGNPFLLDDDGDRQTIIDRFAVHYLPHKPSLLSRLPSLRGKALGCWCAPEPCHGDVLAERASQ